MVGKLPQITQRELLRPMLKDFIDPQHKLVLLANSIDWHHIEEAFEPYYSKTLRPAGSYTLLTNRNETNKCNFFYYLFGFIPFNRTTYFAKQVQHVSCGR